MNKFTYPILLTTIGLISATSLTIQADGRWQAGNRAIAEQSSLNREAIAQQSILYVDPKRGNDSPSDGRSEAKPLRTISAALERATSGTTIQLAPGRYSAGENFPLEVKSGVILRGDESQHGERVVITGGGDRLTRSWAKQNITIAAGNNSQILGVTVTNPNTRGTGIWVENTNPTIRNSTFVNNNREGIFVSGTGNPTIENNKFTYNGGNGISVTRDASGQIIGNEFHDTGFGLAIGHNSTPMIANNQIRQNRIGIVVTQQARPVLQGNTIENNTDYGLVAIAQSQPQIASSNVFRGNERTNQLITRGQQDTPPTPDDRLSHNTQFSCEPYGNGYATIAHKTLASIPQPMITWNNREFDTPQNRCSEVTQKLNQLVVNHGGQLDRMLFATGRVNNSKVVCLVDDVRQSCQPENMLFNLSGDNASNPAEVLRRLVAFSVQGKGNPVQELGEEAIAPLESVARNLEPELGLWFVNQGEI
ncbi:right-handed parallel beta-helix repeat-containing protein [Oxynema aestuarii]|jgi:parallel beta-helix repeat protein|uniref:DUF1565 domain-containing protein n=1 Tax=Oxynema aestuarii AP17 TaxID=2064643 RepID=A0A6H1U070_9CYAN|nr:right-handed parallel beta-helix repeat-containing protein [Oxynema aestuarii]QIZ71836.1 DUF1565 domain-containing protein [Oxynema aestuarii AP17]